jgi:hypothetical protein
MIFEAKTNDIYFIDSSCEPLKEGFGMNHRLLKSLVLLLATFALVGCGQSVAETTRTPVVVGEEVSQQQPLVIDTEERTVSVYATVNGKYLEEPTRHGMNFKEGKIGDKSLFQSHANMLGFHDALTRLGAERGKLGDDKRVNGGTKIDIYVTWDGADREYALGEVVEDSTGSELDYRYSGSVTNAVKKFTGCMMCLDSCNVGVTSNSTHPKLSVQKPNNGISITGNPEILPSDGTPVTVKFDLKG